MFILLKRYPDPDTGVQAKSGSKQGTEYPDTDISFKYRLI